MSDPDEPERERRVEVYLALRARDRWRSVFSWPESPPPRRLPFMELGTGTAAAWSVGQ